jgi:alpha-tubulin suppressor-like RCC1 family protein
MIIFIIRILEILKPPRSVVQNLPKSWGKHIFNFYRPSETFCLLFLLSSVMLLANVDSVSSGSFHNLIRKSDGSLLVMGANDAGQLGDATDTNRPNPMKSQIALVTSQSAGEKHSVFVKMDGSLWAMGLNTDGQLGDGSFSNRDLPVKSMDTNVSQSICGWNHTLLIKVDGSLWAMGANDYGQLGIGSVINQNTAQAVNLGTDVVAVAGGRHHTMFIKSDGSLWAVGRNNFGQLGNNSQVDENSPVQILSDGVTAVATGQFHTLLIKTDGSLWAFGRNNSGQLGDGTLNDSLLPVKIVDSGVVAISAGGEHSLFTKSDGSLWGMGFNGFGQLGDASNSDRYSPVEIINADVATIAAGKHHSVFVKTEGSVSSMGLNDYGQLGDGTVLNTNSPVKVNAYFASVNSLGGGAVNGGGQYAFGDLANFEATPSPGYIFGFWSGGATGESSSVTATVTGDLEANATFMESVTDTDGDGLSDFYEITIFLSDPNLADTDGDGFSDFDENRTGLDPNVSNANYRTLLDQRISEASANGFNEGVAWITQNRSTYDFNTSAEVQYEFGYNQGFLDIVAMFKENNASLYYEWEINESIAQAAQEHVDLVRAELANGVTGLTSLAQLRSEQSPHAQNWYYQPGLGWLWTNQSIFPFVYFADSNETGGPRWIYSAILKGLDDGSHFDFLTDGIIDSGYLPNP